MIWGRLGRKTKKKCEYFFRGKIAGGSGGHQAVGLEPDLAPREAESWEGSRKSST